MPACPKPPSARAASTTAGVRACRGRCMPSEHATTLVLVPTMMLAFIVLAAIAVDLTSMHMVERRALDVVSIAASDAAGMIDDTMLQTTGTLRIDGDRAERVIAAHLAAENLTATIVTGPDIVVSPDGLSLTVSLRLQVDHIFLASMPGVGADEFPVRATAHLVVERP